MRQLADGLWTVDRPFSLMGLRLGGRMTVVGLPGGGLLLHSPIPIDDPLAAELRRLGEVRYLVAPNLLHPLALPAAAARYPDARVHAPPGLERKRPDVRIDATLDRPPPADWAGTVDPFPLDGAPVMGETAFLHRPSRTLVCTDFVFHFREAAHLPTRLYLRLNGALGQVAQTRLARRAIRDRAAARAAVDRLLAEDFDRLVMAHGEVLETGGKEALRHATSWL